MRFVALYVPLILGVKVLHCLLSGCLLFCLVGIYSVTIFDEFNCIRATIYSMLNKNT